MNGHFRSSLADYVMVMMMAAGLSPEEAEPYVRRIARRAMGEGLNMVIDTTSKAGIVVRKGSRTLEQVLAEDFADDLPDLPQPPTRPNLRAV